MAGGGEAGAGSGDRPGKGEARAADLDRIGERLERLAAQRRALRKAMRGFGEGFDGEVWAQAFVSPDPDDINRVFTVTGGYVALLNNTVEAVRVGAKLAGVRPPEGALGARG